MIVKKSGIINEIVYRYTVYNDGKYRLYLTLIGLRELIGAISKAKATTDYIRITPFYRNANCDTQMEFEDNMFYLECRGFIDTITQKNHIGLCMGKDYDDLSKDEINEGKILFPLCKINDINTFNKSLSEYSEYLDITLPKLLSAVRQEMQLKDEDLAYGHFAFEVHTE